MSYPAQRADGHAVDVRGLQRAYGQGELAVRDLDITVEWGSVYCLLGRNGAGKTTTVRMLTTLLKPTAGEGTIVGRPLADREGIRRRIGVALQDVALDNDMTGAEHLRLAARLVGMEKARARVRAEEIWRQFGLEEHADRLVRQYSGGMRRRLDIGMALIGSPRVLFLDEPTSALDIQSKHEVWDSVRRLRDGGGTVFLTTHDLVEAETLADTIGVIRDGTLVAAGSPEELRMQVSGTRVELQVANAAAASIVERITRGSSPGATVSGERSRITIAPVESPDAARRLVDLCIESGVDLVSVSYGRQTLEEAFLRISDDEEVVA